MKKITITVLLISMLLSPVTRHVEAKELSPSERQAMMEQIEHLRAVVAQLLVLYAQKHGAALPTSGAVSESVAAARAKSKDAAIKAQLNNLRAAAELSYDSNQNTYGLFCGEEYATTAASKYQAQCRSVKDRYAVTAKLSKDQYCVDSTGFAGVIKDVSTDGYACAVKDETELQIDANDHVQGDRGAAVKVFTYMDFDDPFSKNFFTTMQTVSREYDSDEVAWVYRHFPLEQLHPNAPYVAQAAECVAEEKGDSAFWEFTASVFNGRSINTPTDLTLLPQYAAEAGANAGRFEVCLVDEDMAERVEEDYKSAIDLGARGTPHSVAVSGADRTELMGAQPLDRVKAVIDALLQ